MVEKEKLPPKCKLCDNLVKWNYSKKRWCVYCSAKCRANDPDFKNGIIKKYGKHPGHTDESIQKRTNTCKEKYGVEFPLQHTDIYHQTAQTTINRYGGQLKGSTIIDEKIKNTMVERYGAEYSGQSEELTNKRKLTCIEKYGVKNPLLNVSIQERRKQTLQDKYGVSHSSQCHLTNILPLIADYDWLFDQYVTKRKTSVQIAQELGNVYYGTIISYLRKCEIEIAYKSSHSCKCICWLDSIMERENIYIQHALNTGEFSIPTTKFKADGYCKETNTIYEFHGDVFHGNPSKYHPNDRCHPFDSNVTAGQLYEKTIARENTIKKLGYNLVVMWECEYNLLQSSIS